MKNNNFIQSKNKGKKAEAIVYQLLTKYGTAAITDVSEDKEYQKIDVDFISSEHGCIEIKSDMRIMQCGNLTFEFNNIRKTGIKDGWFNYCEADMVFFVDMAAQHIFILKFKLHKNKIKKLAKKITYNNETDNCKSTLLLLDLSIAAANNIIDYVYAYDKKMNIQQIYKNKYIQ